MCHETQVAKPTKGSHCSQRFEHPTRHHNSPTPLPLKKPQQIRNLFSIYSSTISSRQNTACTYVHIETWRTRIISLPISISSGHRQTEQPVCYRISATVLSRAALRCTTAESAQADGRFHETEALASREHQSCATNHFSGCYTSPHYRGVREGGRALSRAGGFSRAETPKLCYRPLSTCDTSPRPRSRRGYQASAQADARFHEPEALASREAYNCTANYFSTCPTSRRSDCLLPRQEAQCIRCNTMN